MPILIDSAAGFIEVHSNILPQEIGKNATVAWRSAWSLIPFCGWSASPFLDARRPRHTPGTSVRIWTQFPYFFAVFVCSRNWTKALHHISVILYIGRFCRICRNTCCCCRFGCFRCIIIPCGTETSIGLLHLQAGPSYVATRAPGAGWAAQGRAAFHDSIAQRHCSRPMHYQSRGRSP